MKTLTIFEELATKQTSEYPYRCCSLLLRGNSYEQLRVIKEIVLFVTWVGYNLQLEAHLLIDFSCQHPSFNSPHLASGHKKRSDSISNCTLEDDSRIVSSSMISFPFHTLKKILLPLIYTSGESDDQSQHSLVEKAVCGLHAAPEAPFLLFPVSLYDHPFYHQKIIISYSTCCRNTSKQCLPYQLVHIDYYSSNDFTLGSFLENFCFQEKVLCGCGQLVHCHLKSFLHANFRLNISVYTEPSFNLKKITLDTNNQIWTWGFCKKCQKSEPIYSLSVGITFFILS